MLSFLDPLRYMTYDNAFLVALVRLSVAVLCGGIIGLERGKKRRPAGFRTHMLVCLGAALAMVVGQYLSMMVEYSWASLVTFSGASGAKNTDVSRLGAQVINGIGFLGAGTIIVTGHQEVKGLTTAAGLWASACMGLAVGAGFIEGALVGCLLIALTIVVLTRIERLLMARARNINLYIEFASVEDIGKIISAIKAQSIRIFDVDINKSKGIGVNQSAVVSVRLPKRMSHTSVLALLASVEQVRSVEEL